VGDLFDFWFEYKAVIPKGFSRLIGKLGNLQDQGVRISIFTGNHDMWMFDYFEKELGIPIYRAPIRRTFSGKSFLIGHGDGLGPGDRGYKLIKRVFASPYSQWLFARLHPNFAFSLASFWSRQSRAKARTKDQFISKDREWLVSYANDVLQTERIDYFIFGHRHLPIDCLLDNGHSRYINLGDWMVHNSFASFDGVKLELQFFENEDGEVISL
jgi:UDP-2,3-diacylglucosamine hydrolase